MSQLRVRQGVFAAFEEELKSLCLNEFPCGVGSWNSSHFGLKSKKSSRSVKSEHENEDTDEEDTDSLIEYLIEKQSPWALEENWSTEVQQLKQLAIKSPWLLKDRFIFSFFRSLRLVDKEICDVDENLLRLCNLEELVLSANKISKINFHNLPRTLKVLELCSNEISSLGCFCSSAPPELQHLGLGQNKIFSSTEYKYFSADFWPNLVSLDLSFNDLEDLHGIISKVATLPKLRLLLLRGNPLCLTPGYRGYTVDSLPMLSVLDEVWISPDEKHCYNGLAKKKVLFVDAAQVVVNVGKIKGIPEPINLLQLDNPPGFPLITYTYFITYEFLQDLPQRTETGTTESHESSDSRIASESVDLQGKMESIPCESKSKPVQHPQTPADGISQSAFTSALLTSAAADTKTKETRICSSVATYSTQGKPWANVIECDYKKEHVVTDLYCLKNFLLRGPMVTVKEEKILSWPADKTDEPENVKPQSAKKGGGKEKDSIKGGRGSAKDKRKKKEVSVELRHDPPIVRTLGSVHVKLEYLVAGDHAVETVCDFGILNTEQMVKASPPAEKKDHKKGQNKKEDKKVAKTGRDSAASQSTTASTKGKRKGKGKHDAEESQQEQPIQPVPLSAEFKVQLHHWESIAEALKAAGKQ